MSRLPVVSSRGWSTGDKISGGDRGQDRRHPTHRDLVDEDGSARPDGGQQPAIRTPGEIPNLSSAVEISRVRELRSDAERKACPFTLLVSEECGLTAGRDEVLRLSPLMGERLAQQGMQPAGWKAERRRDE